MDYNKKNGQLNHWKIYESLYRNAKFQYEIITHTHTRAHTHTHTHTHVYMYIQKKKIK